LNARLNPLAKNPPNGPITELNIDNDNECKINGYTVKVDFPLICTHIKKWLNIHILYKIEVLHITCEDRLPLSISLEDCLATYTLVAGINSMVRNP